MLFAILNEDRIVISVTASDADLSDATHNKLPDMTPVEAVLGLRWDGTTYVVYPLPPLPPFPDISDRQCFQALAGMGRITEDEALAAVTVGALPKVVTAGIASLPADQQFAAKMMLCGATTFRRAHPMTPVFGAFLGLDPSGLDALWQAALPL